MPKTRFPWGTHISSCRQWNSKSNFQKAWTRQIDHFSPCGEYWLETTTKGGTGAWMLYFLIWIRYSVCKKVGVHVIMIWKLFRCILYFSKFFKRNFLFFFLTRKFWSDWWFNYIVIQEYMLFWPVFVHFIFSPCSFILNCIFLNTKFLSLVYGCIFHIPLYIYIKMLYGSRKVEINRYSFK